MFVSDAVAGVSTKTHYQNKTMSTQTNSTDIHPSSAIVSGGGRGVSYELKTAGASPCPAVGTCERDAPHSSSKDGLEGKSDKSAVVTSLEVTTATDIMKDDDSHVMKDDDSHVMKDDDSHGVTYVLCFS